MIRLRRGLESEGYEVTADATQRRRIAVMELRSPLCVSNGVALRGSLAARGYAYVVCPASLVVATWITLRRVGLEPKQTVFVHPFLGEPASDAVLICRPAKRGGLSVTLEVSEGSLPLDANVDASACGGGGV